MHKLGVYYTREVYLVCPLHQNYLRLGNNLHSVYSTSVRMTDQLHVTHISFVHNSTTLKIG